MNRLEDNNYTYCESSEIRNNLLENLKNNGYSVDEDSMTERDNDGDYETYPNIKWTGRVFTVQRSSDVGMGYEISMDEFRLLTEITPPPPPTSHRGSILRHNFIYK